MLTKKNHVCYFIAISEFKLELSSGNAQIGVKSSIWRLTSKNNIILNMAPLPCSQKLCVISRIQILSCHLEMLTLEPIDFSACATLKFDGWPRETIGHLFRYANSSFEHHFVAICEFKLQSRPGNALIGANIFYLCGLNRHQTILHTFSQLFLNLTLSGVPHLYRQLPNGQYLSDLYKMCNLEANLWKMWTGDHRILTYIFKWERLNTAGRSHTLSIGHWVAPLYND